MLTVNSLTSVFGLPELKITRSYQKRGSGVRVVECEKKPNQEYCTNCSSGEYWVHQYVVVRVKDAPVRDKSVELLIKKRRLKCKNCKKVFTEPVPGINKHKRFTQRFKRHVQWACETYRSLKLVRKYCRCSNDTIYRHFYESLELNRKRKLSYPWPKHIGIDEHLFKRGGRGQREFASLVVDHVNKRPFELIHGRRVDDMKGGLSEIEGRSNVKYVSLDLCDPYKKFVKEFFPKAEIVADKFHVLRLLTPHLLRRRKDITQTYADSRAKRLLTVSSKNLKYWERQAISSYLKNHPELEEVYIYKEALHKLYRCRGINRARESLNKLINEMAHSELKEIKTLRKTLIKWKSEILNYFVTGLTNARAEGFNNIAKLLKRNGFGFKNFNNYRLRLLSVSF